jgi:hypothetical protein
VPAGRVDGMNLLRVMLPIGKDRHQLA